MNKVIGLVLFILLACFCKAQQVARPMLNPNLAVPNCGIFRTWNGSLDDIKIIQVPQVANLYL